MTKLNWINNQVDLGQMTRLTWLKDQVDLVK